MKQVDQLDSQDPSTERRQVTKPRWWPWGWRKGDRDRHIVDVTTGSTDEMVVVNEKKERMKVDPYLQRSNQVINRTFAEMANPLHLSIKLT